MATTLTVLMQRVLESIGEYRALSVTSAPSTTVITDTKLRRYAAVADVFNDRWWVYWTLLSGAAVAAADQKRLLIDSTTTTATMETATTITAAADTYLLMPFDPDFVKNAISRAAEYLFHRGLHVPVYDHSLIVDNLLANSNFTGSVTSNAFTSWTRGGSATVTAETTIVRIGSQSAKMVGTAAADGQYQAPHVGQDEMTGKTAYLAGHLLCATADKARLRINWDDTNYESYAYHSGKDQWEFQKISVAIPATATKVEARCSSEGTAYFNQVALCVDPINRYTIPSAFLKGPYQVLQQVDERLVGTDGDYLPLSNTNRPVRGRTLRLLGKGMLTLPSADTDTMEVSEDQVRLLVARAAMELYSILAWNNSAMRDEYQRGADLWETRTERMIQAGMALSPHMAAAYPRPWLVEESGETRYLVLPRH